MTLVLRPSPWKFIITVDAVGWPRHDGSKLDLTGCRALRGDVVSNSFFFDLADPNEACNGFWALLPLKSDEFMVCWILDLLIQSLWLWGFRLISVWTKALSIAPIVSLPAILLSYSTQRQVFQTAPPRTSGALSEPGICRHVGSRLCERGWRIP